MTMGQKADAGMRVAVINRKPRLREDVKNVRSPRQTEWNTFLAVSARLDEMLAGNLIQKRTVVLSAYEFF